MLTFDELVDAGVRLVRVLADIIVTARPEYIAGSIDDRGFPGVIGTNQNIQSSLQPQA